MTTLVERLRDEIKRTVSLDLMHHEAADLIEEQQQRIAELEKDAERLDWLERKCVGASDSERYLPFRIYWKHKGIRKAIDDALEQKEIDRDGS